MPRNISFSMTTEAVRNRTKTVTRRLSWWDLKPGTILQAVEKAQGLKKGEKVKPLGLIRVVSVKQELLIDIRDAYDDLECVREGFPHLAAWQFVDMFAQANRIGWYNTVNRIEFEYVDA